MKTFAKVSLIVAGISLSAGIALTVIGGIANKGKPIRMYYDHGFHLDSEGKIIEMKKTVVDDFSNIKINVPDSDIIFVESDEYAVEYRIRSVEVICESEDGTLNINTNRRKFDINLNFFNFSKEDLYVYVYYPKGAEFGLVDLDSSAGDVKIENGFTCEKLIVDLSAGEADIKNVKGDIEVDMSAGDFDADDCEFGYTEFDLSAGDVTLRNCTIGGGKVDMSAGSFDATGLILLDDLAMDLSAGSVEIVFVEGQKIGYDFDLSAGSATINGEKRGDEFTMKDGCDIILSADISAGSIDITNK